MSWVPCVITIKSQWKGDYHLMVRDLTAFDQERCRSKDLNPMPTLTEWTTAAATRPPDSVKGLVPIPFRVPFEDILDRMTPLGTDADIRE